MVPKCIIRSVFVVAVILLASGLAACGAGSPDQSTEQGSAGWVETLLSWDVRSKPAKAGNLSPGTYAVDPIFEDLYNALGGEEVLGSAISPSIKLEGKSSQYTESSLMIFDPVEPAINRFKLAPLGISLGIAESESGDEYSGDGRVINGYLVNAVFLEEYERLGGARFAGRPISAVIKNDKKARLEQYFENLGFYQLEGDNDVHLLPYGAYACDRNCRSYSPLAGIPARQPILPASFLQKTLELGLPLVGKPLTGLHLAPDGKQEVIFENLVLVADADSPQEISLRPITEQLSEIARGLSRPEQSDLSVFVEIEKGLGYNVPLHFISYLEQFGGMAVAGRPISAVFSPHAGVYWQCFENLCLQFDLNAEGDQRLRPVPLGVDYKVQAHEQVDDFASNQNIKRIDIRVWEKEPYVSAADYQQIHAVIYDEGKPVKNFEPLLIATMPDGSQHKAYFPPSDQQGVSAIKLAPIPAPNGTLIAYRVCLFGLDGEENCVGDNYLIWDTE